MKFRVAKEDVKNLNAEVSAFWFLRNIDRTPYTHAFSSSASFAQTTAALGLSKLQPAQWLAAMSTCVSAAPKEANEK